MKFGVFINIQNKKHASSYSSKNTDPHILEQHPGLRSMYGVVSNAPFNDALFYNEQR